MQQLSAGEKRQNMPLSIFADAIDERILQILESPFVKVSPASL